MTRKIKSSASIVAELRQNLERLIAETDRPSLSVPARRKMETEIRSVVAELDKFLKELDPIRQPSSIFDPSNPKVVGRFVSLALVAQQRYSLTEIDRFYGSGVYAIYYNGSFPLYSQISGTETPIYVGQAAPAENHAKTPMEQGDKLYGRLTDHKKNIGKAESTLSLTDFEVRFLVVQSGWETAAEDYLIELFRPIWNKETKILFGIGKHGDSAQTRGNKRSPWDTLHPGRDWAAASAEDSRMVTEIERDVIAHFASHPVFKDMDDLLASFIGGLRQI